MKMYRYFLILLLSLVALPTTIQPVFGALSKNTTVDEFMQHNVSFSGDFDSMVKRRFIRVLMPYSKTFFFFDGAEPKGLSYESATHFSNFINEKLKTRHLKVNVIVIPTPRDQLFSGLSDGLGDIAIGNLTKTEKRLKLVDFSDPWLKDVSEIVVSSKSSTPLKNVFDLSGESVHVRKSSSYYTNLEHLNEVLKSTGKALVNIKVADEELEDEDLMEMVNADLIPYIVVDKHKADFWGGILPNIQLHPQAEVASGGNIGWAFRKNSPKLKQVINEYVKKHKKGTLIGNVVFNRYLKNTKYVTDAVHGENIQRFNTVVDLFAKYGDLYDFDYLMLTALAYQESRLVQSLKSKAGAVGVMQILPSTAKDKMVDIHDIHNLEPNIHAGTKYLRYLANSYFPESTGIDQINRALFSFASYNAGPNRISRLRKEAEKQGLDPNVWFNNVELIAAKRIGRETVQYVSNIFKYYTAYKLQLEKRNKSK